MASPIAKLGYTVLILSVPVIFIGMYMSALWVFGAGSVGFLLGVVLVLVSIVGAAKDGMKSAGK